MHQPPTGLAIDVYSDIVCPWCYIGKRRLERALAQSKPVVWAEITWRPFQLNPTMPSIGMDRRVYMEAKFGGPAAMKAMQDHVAAVGALDGIDFAFDRIGRTPNTFDAHRLIWFAQRAGRQDPVVDALFEAYFVEGVDLSTQEGLLVPAERAGLSRDKTEAFLQSDEGVADVRREASKGHWLGISGVPFFVFDETMTISGAQPVESFMATIGQLSRRET